MQSKGQQRKAITKHESYHDTQLEGHEVYEALQYKYTIPLVHVPRYTASLHYTYAENVHKLNCDTLAEC